MLAHYMSSGKLVSGPQHGWQEVNRGPPPRPNFLFHTVTFHKKVNLFISKLFVSTFKYLALLKFTLQTENRKFQVLTFLQMSNKDL